MPTPANSCRRRGCQDWKTGQRSNFTELRCLPALVCGKDVILEHTQPPTTDTKNNHDLGPGLHRCYFSSCRSVAGVFDAALALHLVLLVMRDPLLNVRGWLLANVLTIRPLRCQQTLAVVGAVVL